MIFFYDPIPAKVELYCRAVALGGTLTGEHGIGLGKAPFTRRLLKDLLRIADRDV